MSMRISYCKSIELFPVMGSHSPAAALRAGFAGGIAEAATARVMVVIIEAFILIVIAGSWVYET